MLKRIFAFIIITALSLFTAGFAAAETWQFDKAHSQISFHVRHMVINKVSGTFSDYSGTVEFDGKNFADAKVGVTINVTSINTGIERRDNHLRSPEFFAVDSFPTMTFTSTQISPLNGDKFEMTGDLTMRGITKQVTFECVFNGMIDDSWGNTRAGFTATSTVNRQDFDVAWDNKLQDGSLIVSDNVNIELNMEILRPKEEK